MGNNELTLRLTAFDQAKESMLHEMEYGDRDVVDLDMLFEDAEKILDFFQEGLSEEEGSDFHG